MPVSAYSLVRSTILDVTRSSTGGKVTLGILIALWSASKGFDSIRMALNSVYRLEENRPIWHTKALSLLFTLVISLLVLIALATMLNGWELISLIMGQFGFIIEGDALPRFVQWIIVLAVLLLIFGMIYNLAPARVGFRWIWITPGAIAGVVLWLSLSTFFRLYLQYFNTYDRTYGSLGAVIILLLWLFLTALVILLGGVLNSVIVEMSDTDLADRVSSESAGTASSDAETSE